jgi:WD40 repeat protein
MIADVKTILANSADRYAVSLSTRIWRYARPMRFSFDAYVTDVLFVGGQAAFALADGTVAWEGGARAEAHDGVILCAAPHPSGSGLVTGGDDGRVVVSRSDGADQLAEIKGRWIDAVATSAESGLVAFAAAREVHVRDVKAAGFARCFPHERSVAALAFDPKGRRLAAATYGAVALWYGRIADQKPVMLRWAGSHIGVTFSPDGRFVISSMQEAALHGWRVTDAKDMRMGGYPSKVRSLAFLDKGQWLATSGAQGAVLWPFAGSQGPMGKQATQIGFDAATSVARVAGSQNDTILAAGLDDGRVWACSLAAEKIELVKAEKGPPITALAVLGRDRVAWGDESGAAGVEDLPPM